MYKSFRVFSVFHYCMYRVRFIIIIRLYKHGLFGWSDVLATFLIIHWILKLICPGFLWFPGYVLDVLVISGYVRVSFWYFLVISWISLLFPGVPGYFLVFLCNFLESWYFLDFLNILGEFMDFVWCVIFYGFHGFHAISWLFNGLDEQIDVSEEIMF